MNQSLPPQELWGGSAAAILGAGILLALEEGLGRVGREECRPLLAGLPLGRPVSSVLCSHSLRSDIRETPLSIRPQPLAPTPRVPSWVPAPISNCSLGGEYLLPSPGDPAVGEGSFAVMGFCGVFLGGGVPLQFRGEGLAPV